LAKTNGDEKLPSRVARRFVVPDKLPRERDCTGQLKSEIFQVSYPLSRKSQRTTACLLWSPDLMEPPPPSDLDTYSTWPSWQTQHTHFVGSCPSLCSSSAVFSRCRPMCQVSIRRSLRTGRMATAGGSVRRPALLSTPLSRFFP
jgi:hypothetical protein